jgi:cyclophilin family peptidyl-prolyl cis-trans isomerase
VPGCLLLLALAGGCVESEPALPDGLYAEMHTSRGLIVARLDAARAPMTVANFVGLAEGTIANDAVDPGEPYYDGSVYHRVVLGHVIQTGIPVSDRAETPGYTFPNEIHAELSHGRAGMLNMANSGPHTNAAQFTITLGDRSYLDGDYIVFGEVMEGLDVVMRIGEGDVLDSVRIVRVGEAAEAVHPTTESFMAVVRAAGERVAAHEDLRAEAERAWIAERWPEAPASVAEAVTVERTPAPPGTAPVDGPVHVRYTGVQVRYRGSWLGYDGPVLEETPFASGEDGAPGAFDPPRPFPFEAGTTSLNPALDRILPEMAPGERRVVLVPAGDGYGLSGLYTPEVPGEPRFIISPSALLVYEVELLRPG